MPIQRRTKKIVILDELVRKITSGQFRQNEAFPSARELAEEYHISQRTACLVIQELSQKGLVDTSPGRRTRIRDEFTSRLRPDFAKPIAIIVPGMELLQISYWRQWLLQHLQQRLLEDGTPSIWLTEDFKEHEVTGGACSGFVVAGELLPASRWEVLRRTGLPCVRLSFGRPHPNTVYVDFRPAMDAVVLYLALQKCNKVILLACEQESKETSAWLGRIGCTQLMQDYNIDQNGLCRVEVTRDKQEDLKTLHALITASPEKIAFLALNPSDNPFIVDMMRSRHQHLGRDYEIISFSHAPGETSPGRYIDLKCPEIVEKMLEILYLHQMSGEAQLGKII